uniref:Tartrate-resistant acid phosphatase type 5 n=1 Tax=Ciona savignyi TaxID=51511 RepID=H2ZPY5_CIOSA
LNVFLIYFACLFPGCCHSLNYETNSDVLKLVVMGDWGGLPFYPYYSPFEYATSKHLMNVAVGGNYHAVLALGDNFYFNGVTDEYDSRFQNTFENVFNNQAFETIPWFVLGGNHDHYGNITGQLEYTKHSSRWHYPALWYKLQLSGIGFNITVIMIDTVTLCGNTVYDGAQPKGTDDHEAAESQLSFIEDSLKQTTDSYVIVAGHFPVWSVAEHGPTECLLQKLKPLLEKYKATAYMCGHDHNLQHIREANSTVDYFVSGAVDVVTPSMKHKDAVPANSLQFYWGNLLGLGGFATVDATKDEMMLKYHSATGSVLYSYAMKPRI